MAQKNFSELQYVDFRRFSGFLDGNVSYTAFFTKITKIGFFFASAQWLLSYGHIQKPEVNKKHPETKWFGFSQNQNNELCFLTSKNQYQHSNCLKLLSIIVEKVIYGYVSVLHTGKKYRPILSLILINHVCKIK